MVTRFHRLHHVRLAFRHLRWLCRADRRHPAPPPCVRLAAILLAFCILGAWRYAAHPYAACPSPVDLAFYNGDEKQAVWATVEGVVSGYPDVRGVQTLYRLRARTATVVGTAHPVSGDLLVQAGRFPGYVYGDRLRVRGQIQTPPVLDNFDYRRYLAQRGIHSRRVGARSSVWRRIRAARLGLVVQAEGLWIRSPRQSPARTGGRGWPNGMLLGIESGIPDDVAEAFKATGTTHVIVISGSNIALLSGR